MNWLPSEWRPERLSPSARVGFRHLLPIDVPVVAKLSSVSFPLNYPEYWFHNFCFNAKDEFCAIGCFVEEHLAGFIVVVRDHISYELVHRTTEFERNLAIEADGKLAYVMSLAVDFRFQRLGIGSEMMRVAIANCLRHQLKPKMIYLHVMHDNVGAQKMYSKMGFQHRHTNPRYYYIDRREKAGFILVKDLGAYDSDCANNKEHLLASDVLAVKKLSKATFESTDDPDWWYEGFCTNRDDDYCAVGCFVDQQLMGYVAISLDYYRKELEKESTEFEDQLVVEADKKLANVESLVVSRHHQRTGIGSELLRLAIHSCLNHKLTPKIIYLYVDHRNTGAQKLYEKMGFMNRHTEPRYYYDVSGKFQPGFVFVKIL